MYLVAEGLKRELVIQRDVVHDLWVALQGLNDVGRDGRSGLGREVLYLSARVFHPVQQQLDARGWIANLDGLLVIEQGEGFWHEDGP